jgi:hypothetical protein
MLPTLHRGATRRLGLAGRGLRRVPRTGRVGAEGMGVQLYTDANLLLWVAVREDRLGRKSHGGDPPRKGAP